MFVNPKPVFVLLLGISSDYTQPITDQVIEVTCPVIGRAQPELTTSKTQKRALVIWLIATASILSSVDWRYFSSDSDVTLIYMGEVDNYTSTN